MLKAQQNGYQRLRNPVIHTRQMAGDFAGNIVIKDTFSGQGNHTFNLHFHLHPEVVISQFDQWIKVERDSAIIWVKLFTGDKFDVIRGSEDPISGWYSKEYGIKVPAPVLLYSTEGEPNNISIITLVSITETKPESKKIENLLNKLECQQI